MLLPFAWLGIWAGKHLQPLISQERFLWICRYLLLASGVVLVLKPI